MKLTKFLNPQLIKLELETTTPPEVAPDANWARIKRKLKEDILWEITQLLSKSGNVVNEKKLFIDMLNREKKATTAIGNGIALPHVRTMQARQFTMAIARSTCGVEFDAVDDNPVHVFIAMISPPYDDHLYLKVYQQIGRLFGKNSSMKDMILAAKSEHEIIRIIGSVD